MNPMSYGNFPASMAVQTNGNRPSYAFKVTDGGNEQPVTFPADAAFGVDVPK